LQHHERSARQYIGVDLGKTAESIMGLKTLLRHGYDRAADCVEAVMGWGDPLVLPRHKMFVGRGDFRAIGDKFLRFFVELGRLQPDEVVLDVGSGIGRMARPLTAYLSSEGSYHGFDIVKDGVEWCSENITSRFPNFQFDHVDIYNKMYNARGTLRACEFDFPYEDQTFDFVLLTSVFTHMLPDDVKNYLSEIRRVTRFGGRCLTTYFILNPDTRRLADRGSSSIDFRYPIEGCLSCSQKIPESAIAYEETTGRELHERYGLPIRERIRYGSWSGREDSLSYQDIVLAARD
jgi:SAM-dependent methyltransferase